MRNINARIYIYIFFYIKDKNNVTIEKNLNFLIFILIGKFEKFSYLSNVSSYLLTHMRNDLSL